MATPPIEDVLFTPEVAEKAWTKHELTQWEVEQVAKSRMSEKRWDIDSQHGGRLIVRGETRGTRSREVFVVLRLVDPAKGVWDCITAFVPTSSQYGE